MSNKPVIPEGYYARYEDKRINDQDLIDNRVEPPQRADITQAMMHTVKNLAAYYARAETAGKLLESAQTTGICAEEAADLFREAMEDLVQAKDTMDGLFKECFVTYRQKEGSVIEVQHDFEGSLLVQ